LVQIRAGFADGGCGGGDGAIPLVIPRIGSLPELEQDVDGLGALERIAKNL
jgi:hypothetical protein